MGAPGTCVTIHSQDCCTDISGAPAAATKAPRAQVCIPLTAPGPRTKPPRKGQPGSVISQPDTPHRPDTASSWGDPRPTSCLSGWPFKSSWLKLLSHMLSQGTSTFESPQAWQRTSSRSELETSRKPPVPWWAIDKIAPGQLRGEEPSRVLSTPPRGTGKGTASRKPLPKPGEQGSMWPPRLYVAQTMQTATSSLETLQAPHGLFSQPSKLPGHQQGSGLTSSSWPWSRPTHRWICNGCSCLQSGRHRQARAGHSRRGSWGPRHRASGVWSHHCPISLPSTIRLKPKLATHPPLTATPQGLLENTKPSRMS